MEFERITARDVRLGDRITRSRKQEASTITEVVPNANSVWLTMSGGWSGNAGRIRPGYTVKFWREI